mmetsp:Transcript_110582/g.276968  ORF Transcript_110582/g.276968 Transcript_110582/m.276968 type:complete len:339 (-) Transcript_110582:67-1083(-)
MLPLPIERKFGLNTPSKNTLGKAESRGSSPGSTEAGSSLSPGSTAAAPREGASSPVAVTPVGPKKELVAEFDQLVPAYVKSSLLGSPISPPPPSTEGLFDNPDASSPVRTTIGLPPGLEDVASAAAGQEKPSLRSPTISMGELESSVGKAFMAAATEHGGAGGAATTTGGIGGMMSQPALSTLVLQPPAMLPLPGTTNRLTPSMWHPEAGSRIALGGVTTPWSPPTAETKLPASPISANTPVLKLDLAEALPEPELGSPDKPTLGSANHRFGNCKPCAFLYTKGCMNGVGCPFCHLCDAGEKKRRQKEKKDQKREMTKWAENQAAAINMGVFAHMVPR